VSKHTRLKIAFESKNESTEQNVITGVRNCRPSDVAPILASLSPGISPRS